MYLGAYHFDGDHATLLPAYERLMQALPATSLLAHVAVSTASGLTVLDACPSEDVFRAFSTSPDFLGHVRAAGLPTPRVEHLGTVRRAILNQPVPA